MADAEPITVADLRRATFRLSLHMRLGRGGFTRVVTCNEHPRLTVSKGRSTFREPVVQRAAVDGVECTTLDQVVERLNAPAPETP